MASPTSRIVTFASSSAQNEVVVGQTWFISFPEPRLLAVCNPPRAYSAGTGTIPRDSAIMGLAHAKKRSMRLCRGLSR